MHSESHEALARQILTHMNSHSGTSVELGSIQKMYDLLVQAGDENPVLGNQHGSFLTMKSNSGLIFGVITIMTGMCR